MALQRSALPATIDRTHEAAARNAVLRATAAAPGEAWRAEVATRVAPGAFLPAVSALEAEVEDSELPGLSDVERLPLRGAWEISPEEPIDVQAHFQAHMDGAVSKTVHLAEDVSSAHIIELIRRARNWSCKGVSFDRHGAGARPPPADLDCTGPACISGVTEERRV